MKILLKQLDYINTICIFVLILYLLLRTGKIFIVPIHDGDCKSVYKEKLKEFYLDNLD